MSFLKFSPENKLLGKTLVDNYFIHDFLPVAPENFIKIYLYGLYQISQGEASMDEMMTVLGVSDEEIVKAYEYFEQYDLADVLSKKPLLVEYRKQMHYAKPRKLNASKYSDISKEIQNLFPDRMVTPAEYNEYYTLIETYRFEPQAILLIIKYCTMLKGGKISYRYILAVARSWAARGLLSFADCEAELLSYSKQSTDIAELLKACGAKSYEGDIISLYTAWTKDMGFEKDVLLFAAKKTKKGGIDKLDSLLHEYYKRKKFTKTEIEEYEKLKEQTREIALSVNKALGIYSQRLDTQIENYIAPWLEFGFDGETLEILANYCYKAGLSTLEAMNEVVQKLFKRGLISADGIAHYIAQKTEQDDFIKKCLQILSIERRVNQYDRQNFHTWAVAWGFSQENILSACNACKNMYNPIMQVHKLLAECKQKGIFDSKEIGSLNIAEAQKKTKNEYSQRNYTKEELQTLFGDDD